MKQHFLQTKLSRHNIVAIHTNPSFIIKTRNQYSFETNIWCGIYKKVNWIILFSIYILWIRNSNFYKINSMTFWANYVYKGVNIFVSDKTMEEIPSKYMKNLFIYPSRFFFNLLNLPLDYFLWDYLKRQK